MPYNFAKLACDYGSTVLKIRTNPGATIDEYYSPV